MAQEYGDMTLVIKLRIANGAGDSVRNSMKQNVPEGLLKNGGGAIRMNGPMQESMNSGATGFDWTGSLPITINITKMLDDNAGKGGMRKFAEKVMRFLGGRKKVIGWKIAATLDQEIRKNIAKAESEASGGAAAFLGATGGAADVISVEAKVKRGSYKQ